MILQIPWMVRPVCMTNRTRHYMRHCFPICLRSRHLARQTASSCPEIKSWLGHGRLTDVLGLFGAPLVLDPGDTAVDATCGNGHDSLTLARLVGPTGHLIAFDKSPAAIANTKQRLQLELGSAGLLPQIDFVQKNHARMLEHVLPETAKLVCFNLGYLPGSGENKQAFATKTSSTLVALAGACQVLKPGGLLSVLCYTGHPGGPEETRAVLDFVTGLDTHTWTAMQLRVMNRPSAPLLVTAYQRE